MNPQPETRPYPGEHSAVLTDKAKYDEFRRKNDVMGPGIACVYGIWTEDGDRKSEIHAFRFDADRFTVAEAKKWLKEHDYKPLSFEPASEGKSMAREIERRILGEPVTCRKRDDGGYTLEGYAAVFNQETVIGDWFREVIVPGAFSDVLNGDTRMLFNHDANYPLARTVNKTLRLSEDSHGLKYIADLNPDDPDAVRVGAKVARGDVSQSSFAFWIDENGEEWDRSEVKAGKLPLRKLTKFAEVADVSPVTFPAYEGTSVSARAEARAKEAAVSVAAERIADEAAATAARSRLDARKRRMRIAELE